MGTTVLVCPCGSRLKATGLAPGTSGRCPGCGRRIRIPDVVCPSPAASVADDEWSWRGSYDLEPVAASGPVEEQTPAEIPGAGMSAVRRPAKAAGERPGTPDVESWWPPRLLYPLRAAEGLTLVGAMGAASWVMATLVPEYCLTLLADGEKLDASSMGLLIALVSAMPVVFLGPLVLVYWLRYLAVVLVACAEGEPDPPRPPDRNFDGFLAEFLPWMIWLVVGPGVGFLPLAAYAAATSRAAPWHPAVAIGLGLAGMPYALMALLMVFLHDDALAARPRAILATIARIGPPFLRLCLTIAFEIALVLGSFAAASLLRAGHFRLTSPRAWPAGCSRRGCRSRRCTPWGPSTPAARQPRMAERACEMGRGLEAPEGYALVDQDRPASFGCWVGRSPQARRGRMGGLRTALVSPWPSTSQVGSTGFVGDQAGNHVMLPRLIGKANNPQAHDRP